ncbi:PPW family C-terminal domain-containing PPE protein, partial [Mycolicibacillus trivialis]
IPAGPELYAYMVANMGMEAQAGAEARARRKRPTPDAAAAPAAASATEEQQAVRRKRRHAKAEQLGRGYEYMTLDQELDGPPLPGGPGVSASGAGTLGFAGTAAKGDGRRAGGLTVLADDQGDGVTGAPMMPSTWDTRTD